eukprot:m.98897 g.98897  ORF g.98897 m.98897 type:complete len:342 (-) comp16763_c0_seq2:127-1152(-)
MNMRLNQLNAVVLSLSFAHSEVAGKMMTATSAVITPQQLNAMNPKEIKKLPNGVPMILHQTWKDRDVLPKHQPYMDSWDRCLPEGWLHVLWTDADAEEFVTQRAPHWFIPTYELYMHPIQRVDVFRYVLLLVWGGVYADLDNECLTPPRLPDMKTCQVYLAETCCGIHNDEQNDRYNNAVQFWSSLRGGRERGLVPPGVQNSLMASRPGHAFWMWMLGLAVEQGPRGQWIQRYFQAIHSTVGVDLLTVANYQYTVAANDGNTVCLLPKDEWHGNKAISESQDYAVEKFVVHHGTHVWDSKMRTTFSIVTGVVQLVVILALLYGVYYMWKRRNPTSRFPRLS